MAHTIKQLAQSAPAGTSIASIYSPGASTETVIHNINICNTTATAATFQICVDDDGTTYDATTALHWNQSIPAKTTVTLEKKICMNNSAGNLAVQTGTANALTFTVNGEEFS